MTLLPGSVFRPSFHLQQLQVNGIVFQLKDTSPTGQQFNLIDPKTFVTIFLAFKFYFQDLSWIGCMYSREKASHRGYRCYFTRNLLIFIGDSPRRPGKQPDD